MVYIRRMNSRFLIFLFKNQVSVRLATTVKKIEYINRK